MKQSDWLRERLIEDGFDPDDPQTVRVLVEIEKLEQELKDLGLADHSILTANTVGVLSESDWLWIATGWVDERMRSEAGAHSLVEN